MCTVCGCGDHDTHEHEQGHTRSHPHEHSPGHEHGHDGDPAHEHPHSADHDHDHEHTHSHTHEHDHNTAHDHDHQHSHSHDHDHSPDHSGGPDHPHRHPPLSSPTDGLLHFGTGPAGVSVAGVTQSRLIHLERDILSKNNAYAATNRRLFEVSGILALNLVSSPGSGKTTLLVRTLQALKDQPIYVIEGDQQTSADADRIRAAGAPAIQINTGKGCHLDAHMVGHALQQLKPTPQSLVLIENVGNLVCPAAFDLGEAHKVAILSVTEGEDKPLKYPDMFAAASLMLLNKTDLLPHVDFNVEQAIANARRVNPSIRAITLSARTGEGMAQWLSWIKGARLMAGAAQAPGTATTAASTAPPKE